MMKKTFKSAEIVETEEGKQYHIGCKPGDVAPNILLCGDPDRAHRVAGYFKDAKEPITSREFVTITGEYKDMPMTVMATGMGPGNTEIAFIELSQIVKEPTLIRIGSSGALKEGIELADLVISTAAVRMESTSSHFVVDGYPAVANHEVILALVEAARKNGFPYHLGLTATAPGFYGAQSRNVPGFKPRDEELPETLGEMNVANFEMEASVLFTLATLRGFRAGAVCAVYATRRENEFIDVDTKDLAEKRCIETGLGAFEVLDLMDEASGDSGSWSPSMGLKE